MYTLWCVYTLAPSRRKSNWHPTARSPATGVTQQCAARLAPLSHTAHGAEAQSKPQVLATSPQQHRRRSCSYTAIIRAALYRHTPDLLPPPAAGAPASTCPQTLEQHLHQDTQANLLACCIPGCTAAAGQNYLLTKCCDYHKHCFAPAPVGLPSVHLKNCQPMACRHQAHPVEASAAPGLPARLAALCCRALACCIRRCCRNIQRRRLSKATQQQMATGTTTQ